MHWCGDDLGFVRGRLGFIGSQLGMAGGLLKVTYSKFGYTLGLIGVQLQLN